MTFKHSILNPSHCNRAGGRAPRTPRPGEGARVCSGVSCYVWKNF